MNCPLPDGFDFNALRERIDRHDDDGDAMLFEPAEVHALTHLCNAVDETVGMGHKMTTMVGTLFRLKREHEQTTARLAESEQDRGEITTRLTKLSAERDALTREVAELKRERNAARTHAADLDEKLRTARTGV